MFPVSSALYPLILACIALAAGALVPFQAGSNALLGRTLGHPLWATLASLVVSILLLLPILGFSRVAAPRLTDAVHLPYWAWFGGISGVIFITAALLLTPQLGATRFIVCVIAGQMLTAMLIDHFGLMGLPVTEISLGRLVGMVMIFSGVVIIQQVTAVT